MAQHDYNIANASFPTVRTDINNVLSAINSSNSGSSRPSGAVAGTIWLDTSGGVTAHILKFYDGGADINLATINTTANTVDFTDSTVTFDIVNDTSPQLGGNLDVNGNSIVSVSNGNISITPNGSGKVILDGLSHPTADGSTGQFLKTDGSGTLSFATVSSDVVSDSSPQLGGSLDVNGNSIVSVSNGNIAITPNGSGKVVLDGISHPTADGSNGQALVTNGSGVLSFGDVSVSFSSVGEHILPSADDTYNLGSSSKQWANIFTGDLHLSNESKSDGNSVDGTKGNWTIQEGAEDLFILNNKSGKKYKFKLEEV